MKEIFEKLMKFCVYGGTHPNIEGWILTFQFPNQYVANVAQTIDTNGIEVSVRLGEWLIEHYEDLNGDEVFERLVEVMDRTYLPPSSKEGDGYES